MRAKVLKPFKDKHSGKLHRVGETLTISKERYQEIRAVGPLVEEIRGKKPEAATN